MFFVLVNWCTHLADTLCEFTALYLELDTPYNRPGGGAFGWGTALQTGRSRVRFPMFSLEFLIDITLPAALWPWGRLNL
jgi:hypothetical protein